jgi:hypothetical protein
MIETDGSQWPRRARTLNAEGANKAKVIKGALVYQCRPTSHILPVFMTSLNIAFTPFFTSLLLFQLSKEQFPIKTG